MTFARQPLPDTARDPQADGARTPQEEKMDRQFYADRANIVFVSEWLARNARDAQQRDSMHFMTDDLNSRVSALSRDLREAAISGEAKDPDAAMRIAGDLERMVAGEYFQEW